MKYLFFSTINIFILGSLLVCCTACGFTSKSSCTPKLADEIGAIYHQSLFQEEVFWQTVNNNRDYFRADGDCIKCMEELALFFDNASTKFHQNNRNNPSRPGDPPGASGFEIWALELDWLSKTIPEVVNGNRGAINKNVTLARTSTRLVMETLDPFTRRQMEQDIGGVQSLVREQFVYYESVMNR